jgi:hypothetical protein
MPAPRSDGAARTPGLEGSGQDGAESSPALPPLQVSEAAPQAPTCARCGTPGRTPIAADPSDPRQALRISFDARGPGQPGLLCPRCRGRPA